MTQENRALAIPDSDTLKREIEAINNFQKIVKSMMIKGQDYGVIPGTKNLTLLKPGAEKITKLLGLADHYVILDQQEDWNKPFFRFLVRAELVHIGSGIVVSQGLGECNSYESKYRYRWLWPSELPDNFDKEHAVTRRVRVRGEMVTQYRTDNEDIFSQVNTLIKMAKKRALVDAALSAGRLSDIFTQDIEEERSVEKSAPAPLAPAAKPTDTYIDTTWLKEALDILQWADVGKYLKEKYGVAGRSVREALSKLTEVQQLEFEQEVRKRIDTLEEVKEHGQDRNQ